MREEVLNFDRETIFDQNIFFFDVAADVVDVNTINFFVEVGVDEEDEIDNATSVEGIAIDVCGAENAEEDSS